jgi:peptidoglycan/LPS O-acetylase OafA/YrhL
MNVIRIHVADPTASQRPAADRSRAIGGFDLLRAGGALAVVALHACVPYLRHPMPGLVWPIQDSSSSVADVVFWSIEVMIMPLFLMIAGFLMWKSAERLSPRQLVRSRGKRLLIPLAFGILIVLPIDLYLWTLGLVSEGVVPAVKLKSFKFEEPISRQIWGLSHLWFLLYVFLYVAVAALWIRFSASGRFTALKRTVSGPRVLMGALAVVAVATLVFAPEVVWGFQHAFLPVPSKWIYSGVFFAAGCALALHDRELRWVSASSPRMLGLAVVLLATSVSLGTWTLAQQQDGQAPSHAANVLLALLTVAAASTTTLGLLGGSVRYVRKIPFAIRYIASASFWIYLIHHPVLGLVHTDLKWMWPNAAPVVKLCVSFAMATGVSLITYEMFIRRSRLGALLGFDLKPATRSEPNVDDAGQILKLPASQPGRRHAA